MRAQDVHDGYKGLQVHGVQGLNPETRNPIPPKPLKPETLLAGIHEMLYWLGPAWLTSSCYELLFCQEARDANKGLGFKV